MPSLCHINSGSSSAGFQFSSCSVHLEEEFLLRHNDCPTEPVIHFSQSLISSSLQIIKHPCFLPSYLPTLACSALIVNACIVARKILLGKKKKYCFCTLCLVCNVMMFREWSPCLNVSRAQTSLSVSLFRLLVQTCTGICV